MEQKWIYDRSRTVCFSGHRQEKLPDKGDIDSLKMKGLLSILYFEIQQSIEEGYDTFIVGGSRGIDLMAAEFVYQFIHQGKNIRLVVAMPYPEFGRNFKGRDLYMRGNALSEAECVVNVSEKYSDSCYRKRNQFMVDHSSRLIAVVSDWKSGTGQTIRYAERLGIDTKIINAEKFSQMVDNSCDDIEIVEEETQIENLVKLYVKGKKPH